MTRTGWRTLRRRLRHALRHTARSILASLRGHPASTRTRSLPAPAAIHPFDITHGVDTSGLIPGQSLASAYPHSHWSTAYYAIAPSIFRDILTRLAPAIGSAWHRFSFVDLGCGKGRALLLAAHYPFARILGVELDPELARIAAANVQHLTDPGHLAAAHLRCTRIEVRHADATTAPYPDTPLIVYLYHPFAAPVLDRCLTLLERSLRQSPRETWILYVNAEHEYVFAHHPAFRRVWDQVVPMAVEDVLADRTDSSEEHVAAFHTTAAISTCSS